MSTSSFYGDNPTPTEYRDIDNLIVQAETAANTALTAGQNAEEDATLAETYKNQAAASAADSATSAAASANSASSANTAKNDAQTAQIAASNSANAALASANASASSASNASASATVASVAASNTAASETAANAAMIASETARDAAIAAKTASETARDQSVTAKNSAQASAIAASASEANAIAYELSANNWATKTSGPVAGGEFSAKYHAQQAASEAISAASSALVSSTESGVATTKALEAATSSSNAAGSANTASTKASEASSSAASASVSANTATTKAAEAAASAADALSSAGVATTKANEASASATSAATSASTASNAATNAATSASAAASSASLASSSASSAAAAQIAAEAARDQALTAYDNFDDRYLGPKASDPSTDNDGNALVGGTLYFNTTDGIMKLYTGTAWVAAYIAGGNVLQAANNLSDVASVTTARQNLGLGSAALQDASAFATSTHTHTIANITNLQTTLDGKAASTHTHVAADISNSTAAGRTLLTAADVAAQRTALGLGTAALSASTDFATSTHTHTIANITSLQTSLDAKFNVSGGSLTGELVSGPIAAAMAQNNTTASIEVKNNGGTGDSNLAMIRFHCTGAYGLKMGLRADGYFGIGGWSNAAWRWYMAPDGTTVAAGNVIAYSDERLKKNWKNLPDNFVDQLANVRMGTYQRVDMDLTQVGVSAQSLQAILPEAVGEGIDGQLSVAYGNAALAAAVALAQRVVQLEERLAALEAK